MGDFNQWKFEEIIEDPPDLTKVEHCPTRNGRKIDRVFCNFGRSITESDVLKPLETEAGSCSDHGMVLVKAVFPTAPKNNVTYTYRPYTESGAALFVERIAAQDWNEVVQAKDSDTELSIFQKILDNNMSDCFPLNTVTKRTSDPPWVNTTIRRMTIKRRRIYDKQGRSKRWMRLKKKSDDLYRMRAEKYFQKQKEKM